jgi:hypothetical protein
LIAETLSASPFVAGMNPFDPVSINATAPLATLLGPATPQAPGGPNPHFNSRAFWIWTIVQYLTSGRFGWEKEYQGAVGKSPVQGLWPLVSIQLAPIPIDGQVKIWTGFQYMTPSGKIILDADKVVYGWRASIADWRMPESVLMSAQLPIYMQRNLDKYMVNLLRNNMVATTMVISPPFAEADQRRAWEDQFLSQFTGVDKTGATIFGYAEPDEEDPAGKPMVQVERIAQTAVEASLLQLSMNAKNDVCIALGVPRSLLGDASQRIYSNAGAEYRNFWTITMLNMVAEIEDHVNLLLAPEVGPEVGWFDLSKVEALQPPAIFAPPDIAEAINMGVVTPEQVAYILGIPNITEGAEDVQTAPIGEELSYGTGGGYGRNELLANLKRRAAETDPRDYVQIKQRLVMNRQCYLNPEKRVLPKPKRPRIRIAGNRKGFDQADAIRRRVAAIVRTTTEERIELRDWSEFDAERPHSGSFSQCESCKPKIDALRKANEEWSRAQTWGGSKGRQSKKYKDAHAAQQNALREYQQVLKEHEAGTRDGFFGGSEGAVFGAVKEVAPPSVIDVEEALNEKRPYEEETEDPYNGVPADHIEGIGEMLAEANKE